MRLVIVCLFVAFMSAAAGCGSAYPATTGVAFEAIDVLRDPVQIPAAGIQPITRETTNGRFVLTPVAEYRISAVVVSRREYRSGWNAELSPVDLALAWGELTEPGNLRSVRFRQSNRWYFYRYQSGTFGGSFVALHSSNHHIIPTGENVARAVKSLRKGDSVTLEGYLVNVDGRYRNGTVWWRSSLSRADTGDGACELMLVKRVQLGQYLYE